MKSNDVFESQSKIPQIILETFVFVALRNISLPLSEPRRKTQLAATQNIFRKYCHLRKFSSIHDISLVNWNVNTQLTEFVR